MTIQEKFEATKQSYITEIGEPAFNKVVNSYLEKSELGDVSTLSDNELQRVHFHAERLRKKLLLVLKGEFTQFI
ncbi:hypothetical protein [Listeria booriae]|uniref:hypothetical protein n=1 Tax=Listeria booriae TaxID=1552123 RepID=UPI00162655F0|nr:hypothetical protein [Listeria booriae]MBC1233678.1 hypothetical protein [Listeria booriae]